MGGAHLPADTTPSLQSNIFPLQLVFSCSTHAAEGQGREDYFLRQSENFARFFVQRVHTRLAALLLALSLRYCLIPLARLNPQTCFTNDHF